MASQTMQIFRAAKAPLLSETNEYQEALAAPSPPEAVVGVARMAEAGMEDGAAADTRAVSGRAALTTDFHAPLFRLHR